MQKKSESGEVLALQALAWLAGNEELLPVFLAASGADLADLRARVADPVFLIAVLDFILSEDAWVVALCNDLAIPYDALDRARQSLPGGARVHWT